MKTLFFTAAALLATLNMYGQTSSGVINFNNFNAPDDRRIWVNDTGRVGDGTRAAGTGYRIALYWGPRGTPEEGLTQVGGAASFLDPRIGPGTFSGGRRTVTYPRTDWGDGDIVTVQARAWATISGVADTYEAVLAAGLAGDARAQVGKGPVFEEDTSNPFNPTDDSPTPIGFHVGWRGFAITPVPEPSVIALGLLGAGAFLILRCR